MSAASQRPDKLPREGLRPVDKLTDLSAWFGPATVLGKSLHFSSAANLLPFGRRSQVAWPVAIHVGLTLFRLASKCKFVRCRSSAWGGLKMRDYNYRHRPKCRGWKTHDQPVTESQSSKNTVIYHVMQCNVKKDLYRADKSDKVD